MSSERVLECLRNGVDHSQRIPGIEGESPTPQVPLKTSLTDATPGTDAASHPSPKGGLSPNKQRPRWTYYNCPLCGSLHPSVSYSLSVDIILTEKELVLCYECFVRSL